MVGLERFYESFRCVDCVLENWLLEAFCPESLKLAGEKTIMMTDPIADLLTQVRNAVNAKHPKVDVAPSQLKISIIDIFKKVGFIRDYQLYRDGEKGVLRIYLKYVGKNQSVIHGVKRVSRPSRRVYVQAAKIPKVLGGLGVSILSTSRGVMTDEVAREQKVGGELVCTIW